MVHRRRPARIGYNARDAGDDPGANARRPEVVSVGEHDEIDDNDAPLSGPLPVKRYETTRLPVAPDAVAPDGSSVRVLLRLEGGSLAHFELAAGETSTAVVHRTVEEIWYFLGGRGEMWRRLGGQESIEPVAAGVCMTIPAGTHFQFRALGHEPLSAIGVTMPPWPGETEADVVAGWWTPTVRPGPHAAGEA